MDTSSRCPPTPFRPRPSSNPSRCRDLWQAVKEEKGERARGVLREREREERRRERRGKNKEGRFASDRERERRVASPVLCLRPTAFVPSLPPSLLWSFFFCRKRCERGEERRGSKSDCVSATVIIAIVSLSLSLSLSSFLGRG